MLSVVGERCRHIRCSGVSSDGEPDREGDWYLRGNRVREFGGSRRDSPSWVSGDSLLTLVFSASLAFIMLRLRSSSHLKKKI